MPSTREDLLQQLNELQAVHGVDSETRAVIGSLTETIRTLGEEIDDLQQRVTELEDALDEDERRKRTWYSERETSK
ncbi:hypothetical protein [Haladaptatus sp. NG-SE-30]